MTKKREIIIGNRRIGVDQPTFIIAELSANHGFDISIAMKTIEAAHQAGADAVKVQTYTADTITLECDNDYFRIEQGTLWDGQTLHSLYQKAYMPWEWQPKLKAHANSLGLEFFSSPFDPTAVDFLEEMNVPAYKIASFEITDIPLIEYIASKGKPIIISTGIATLSDIERAVSACRRVGNNYISLLKCTSAYPAKIEDANLKMIPSLRDSFDVIAGLSDHTIGGLIPAVSVALGAKIIEKHFILDMSIGGPDASFSMEPEDFANMVSSVRDAEKSLGEVKYENDESLIKNRKFSRSLFVVDHIKEGETLTEQNVRSIRPADGMHPMYLKDVLGKKAINNIEKGTPLNWGLIH